MRHLRGLLLALVCATALVAIVLASGAAARSSHRSDNITLTVWDTETDAGPSREMNTLISQFEKVHPNVTVKRTTKPVSKKHATRKTVKHTKHTAAKGKHKPAAKPHKASATR